LSCFAEAADFIFELNLKSLNSNLLADRAEFLLNVFIVIDRKCRSQPEKLI